MIDVVRTAGLLAAIAFLAAACAAPLRLSENLEDFEQEVRRLERRLIDQPGDAEAVRDLGVIHVRTHHFAKGNEYLQQAYARDPEDPKTIFYLGVANEVLGRRDVAIRLYEQEVSRLSPYRSLMRGRAEQLRRQEARRQVQALLAREGALQTPTAPSRLAVFPLVYGGGNDRYAPLGRGLSEMLMADLASVHSLSLVERLRLQALLDELALAQTAYVDPATAPRAGRLLGAGRLIGGRYTVQRDELAVDVALVSTESAEVTAIETVRGDLAALFDLQKQLVLRLLTELGVELTPAEQEQIQRMPTRNLQAFLAYSRGLQAEDRGDFAGAASFYGEAATIDPGFGAAVERATTVEAMSTLGGTAEEVLAVAVELEPPPERAVDPVHNRIQVLSTTLGDAFVPGQDARDPAQEGQAPLGDPPSPPRE